MAIDFEVEGVEAEARQETAVAVLNIQSVRPRFEDYKKEAEKILQEVNAIEVKDDVSLALAVSTGGSAKKIAKAIETRMKEIILEPSEFVKSVRGFCKVITDRLDEAEKSAKQKVSSYQTRIEMERRKQEELARKASESLQKKLDKEAKKAGIEAPVVLPPVLPETKNIVHTEEGSAYQRKKWTYDEETVDLKLLPEQYITRIPNKKAIKEAIEMGIREIPGVRIFEESKTVFRS